METERRRDIDPFWKDLSEKKQNFRRHITSLAAELKETRFRLASQEQFYATQALARQESENRAKQKMEEEIYRLQKSADQTDAQLKASSSIVDKFFKDLDNLKSQVSDAQATADASAASAQSAELQHLKLSTELNKKNSSLEEQEARVHRLAEKLNHLQNDLQAKEFAQKQLRDEVARIKHDIIQAIGKGGMSKEFEFCRRNLEKINNILTAKDEEIMKLRDEVRIIMSAHWKLKTEDLESQLEQHRRDDLKQKKRVLKMEFFLHETRAQARKLQRAGERRDKALKELKDTLAAIQGDVADRDKKNFWETSDFKVVISMSLLILVLFLRQ